MSAMRIHEFREIPLTSCDLFAEVERNAASADHSWHGSEAIRALVSSQIAIPFSKGSFSARRARRLARKGRACSMLLLFIVFSIRLHVTAGSPKVFDALCAFLMKSNEKERERPT